MKEKLKEVFGNIRSRVTSAFMHSASARGGEREVEELFVERKGSRPFVLSVFFTTCKFMLGLRGAWIGAWRCQGLYRHNA